MRIVRITLSGALLLSFASSMAWGQGAPPSVEFFAEGGGSFLHNGAGEIGVSCPPQICFPVPTSVAGSFSNAGRLFIGGRFRFTRHDALEAGYSYSPNRFPAREAAKSLVSGYNQVDLMSFNYVRYLWLGTRLQPFATAGLGANRFGGPLVTLVGGPTGASAASVQPQANIGWTFAGNYGGGTDIMVQQHLALRLELRDYVAAQPASFVTGTIHDIVPSAGIVFRFK